MEQRSKFADWRQLVAIVNNQFSAAIAGFSIFLSVGVVTATGFLGQALVTQQHETTHQLVNFSDEVVLAAALLTSLLFAMMLYLIGNAYLRTQQLRATNQKLEQEIVKRQQVESVLREREQRLRQLTENIREVFWISNPDKSQMLYVSPMYEDIWGKSCQSLYEQPGSFLDAIHPEDRDRVIAAAPKLLQGNYDEEYRVVRPDGSMRWIRTRAYPICNDAGQIYRIAGIADDISDRVEAKSVLQKLNQELEIRVQERTAELSKVNAQLQQEIVEHQQTEALLAGENRVLEMIAKGAGLDDVLNALAQFVEAQSDEAICSILLVEPNESNLLRQGVAPSLPESYIQAVGSIAIGPDGASCGTAAHRREPVISDIATDPKWADCRDLALSQGLRTCWSTPIFAINGSVLGTWAMYYRTPRQPSACDRNLINIFTRVAGIAIERKRTEDALRLSEERFRRAILHAPSPVMIHAEDGEVIQLSQSWTDLTGYTHSDIPTIADWTVRAYGEKCQMVGAGIDRLYSLDTRIEEGEFAIATLQGETRIWDFSSAPLGQLPAGKRLVISMAKDITERKAAEVVLRQSEERFRTSVENLLDCFGIYSAVRDQSGQIIDFQAEYVNPATCENSLMTKEQHLSQGLCELLPAHREMRLFDEYCQVVETGLPLIKESLVYEDVFGQQRVCKTYDIHVVKLGDGYVASWRDVTERQRAEAEVFKALQRERELNELKSRIITTISHEYRTPLTTILSSAELVERYACQWTEEKKLTHIQRIQTAAKRMAQLVSDVLILGEAEAEKLQFNPVLLNLEHFCRELVEEMQVNVGNQHRLLFSSQGSCTQISLDEKLLRQVLTNLLDNAIKYSPAGGVVRFELACDQEAAIFRIQDRGIGIPAAGQARLFDAFYRASNVGTISGSGVGLAIVKKAVDLHSGEIEFDSEVGVGTTFVVTLPRRGVRG